MALGEAADRAAALNRSFNDLLKKHGKRQNVENPLLRTTSVFAGLIFCGFSFDVCAIPLPHASRADELSTPATHIYFVHGRPFCVSISFMALGCAMLESEFKRQRAQTVRELAEKATDPFIKGCLARAVSIKC
jgi:hypothetical protein